MTAKQQNKKIKKKYHAIINMFYIYFDEFIQLKIFECYAIRN